MKNTKDLYWQASFAAIFCVFLVFLWSMPAVIMGDGFGFFPHLGARNLAETGLFSFTDAIGRILSTRLLPELGMVSAADGRLSQIVIAFLSQWISWDDLVLWTIAGSAILAVGMWCWWMTLLKMFTARVAWTTLVITALMPVYFREAVWFDHYTLSLTCLAAAAAAFVWLKDTKPTAALLFAGLLFGASISAKDVFLIMVPWIGCTFLWKRLWKEGVVFFVAAALVYILPYIGDISAVGHPVNQNIARIWPGAETIANETYLHLYPDPYTYYFDRESFDQSFKDAVMSKGFSDRMADEKVMLSYGLADGMFRRIRLGAWLIVHDIPVFFQRHSTGGVFLWLFALPGALVLWRRDRFFALWLAGLAVSMFIIIRFVLMYEREHFVNVAWMFALLSGIGIAEISTMQKYMKETVAVAFLTLVCAMQLLQANRFEFAARYRRNNVSELRAIAQTFNTLPEESIIALDAHPTDIESLALLSNSTLVLLRESTINRLHDNNVHSVFNEYGITHAFGYDVAVPAEPVIVREQKSIPPSTFTKWLIHLIR